MLNKVELIGYVGQNPKVYTHDNQGNETHVVSFSLATNHFYLNKDSERVSKTTWHNITAFGKIANVVRDHVKKGMPLYIEGSLKYTQYEKDDATIQNRTEIVVAKVLFLGKKGDESSTESPVENLSESDDFTPF